MPSWLGTLLKAGTTFGLLYFLLDRVELEDSLNLLAGADGGTTILALLVLIIQVGLAIFRWHLVMINNEIGIPFGRSTRYFWLGLFFNQVLPSSIGGDAVRGYCLVREGQSLGGATSAVLLDRMLGMIGLALLIVLTIPMTSNLIDDPNLKLGVSLSFLVFISVITSVLFMDFFMQRFSGWRYTKGLMALASDARRILLSRMGWRLILLSVVIHVFSIFAMGLLSRALNIEIAWLALAVIVPVMTLLVTVPVSIAGWGVREGVMVMGLGYAGIGAEQALVLSILYGLLLLVVALPGGALWLVAPKVRSFAEGEASVKEIQ